LIFDKYSGYSAIMPNKLPLSEQVRKAIDAAGVTRYRIAKETGLSESALSRFMSGERELSLPAVDRLAEYLGLSLCDQSKQKKE
jgi:transcriptional regulator with XRE-family HTH domain